MASMGGSSGVVVGRAYAEIATVVGCATIPADNTIPQNTEGTQVLTASITPKSDTNRLRVTFSAFGDVSGGSGPHTLAIFKDSDVNALAAKIFARGDASLCNGGVLVYEFVAGSTSPITINARAGSASGTLNINGNSAGTAFFGGAGFSTLVIEELKV